MDSRFVPYVIVLAAFVVALPFMNPPVIKSAGMAAAGIPEATAPVKAYYADGQVFVTAKAGLIFSTGGYYDYVNGKWQEFHFSGKKEWLKGSAAASFYASGLRKGTNFIAIYSCEYDDGWKCGCNESGCNNWVTSSFVVP